jgi:hypothetical protein
MIGSRVSRRVPSFRALAALLVLSLATATAAVAVSCGEREPHAARAARVVPHVVPAAPSHYKLPADALRVRSSAQLRRALLRTKPTAIVLADGVYGGSAPFSNPHGHRLYAAHLGRAILRAGLNVGGNAGPAGGVVRGLVFDVRDPAKTVQGAEILVWGTARDAAVRDVELRGHSVIRAGLVVRQPEGFRGARLVAHDFTDYGVVVDANDGSRTRLENPFRLADVRVARVARRVPGSSNGTGEACVWVGNPGIVRRVHVRRCAWTGLWTGTATTRALFNRIDINKTRTGVYLEHFTRDSTFQNVRVGSHVRVGMLAEWASPAWGGRPASVGNVVQDSWIAASVAGVYLDEGTTRTTVRRSTFVNQRWAAIGNYRGIGNRFYGNDYRGIARGADEVTEQHLSSFGNGGQ